MPPSQAIVRQLSGLARIITRTNNADTLNYFGPGIAVAPIAPEGTPARGWQYWPNQNMVFTPRPDAEYSAQDLRSLATYPLARICIENCKDVITAMPRQIRAKKRPGESNKDVDKRGKNDATLKMLNDFFDCPDNEHDWESWLRPWLEGVYVGDWASVLVRRMASNQIRDLRVIDGAFTTCLIDEQGYTPAPPFPAYQQLWSGTPAQTGGIPFVNLTTDQLVYRPRNIVPRNTVSSYLYGMSQTEQLGEEIKIGQQRLNWVLLNYTAGNIPDLLHIVPPNISTDQLETSQKALDAEMSGQSIKRVGNMRLVQGFVDRTQPGGTSGDQFVDPKEKLFADPFDEMHIRKMAFGYGTSAQRILKQMNRASAEAGQDSSEEEGTQPIASSVKGMVDWIIARIFRLGFNSYELTFDDPRELDPLKRAQADALDVNAGIETRDEKRIERGKDPMGGTAATLTITTASGVVPVDLDEQVAHAKDMADAMPKPAPMGGDRKKPVEKRHTPRIEPGRITPTTRMAMTRMEKTLSSVFESQREKAVIAAERVLKMRKADDPQKKADSINDAIEAEWLRLPSEARAALEQAAKSGMVDAFLQVEVSDAGILSSVNTIASEYASKRAAELIGMRYNSEGALVPNPSAKWAISDTTRDRLREIVKNAFEEKTPFSELIDDIRNADIFSEARATMIARTEISNAQVQANFDVWKKSGLVTKVKWLALGPDPCPTCIANDGLVRELGKAFPSGNVYPTAHPNCYCILQAVGFAED